MRRPRYSDGMKAPWVLCIVVSSLVAGCSDDSGKSAPQTNSTSSSTTNQGSVVTAPVDYLDSLGKAQRSMVKSVDLSTVNHAIQQFQVEQGRNPKDLNELVQEKYIPSIPPAPYGSRIDYDPATGVAKVVKEP